MRDEITATELANQMNVQAIIDPAETKKDSTFSQADLDGAMTEQASLYAHYVALAAKARAQHDRIKNVVMVYESKLYAKHRELLIASGEKVTEKQVETAVKTDPRWLVVQNKVIEAKQILDLCTGAVETIDQRKAMLIQIASDRRKEREGELRMGASKAVTDSLRDDVLRQLQKVA